MIHIVLPCLPPSLNNAYASRGKIRFPTKELTQFKTTMKTHIAREYAPEMLMFVKDHRYALHARLSFLALATKGWPKKAANRYKRVDATNRFKILEDTIMEATGVDDSHNFVVSIEKTVAAAVRTDVWIWDLDKEVSPHHVLCSL